MLYIILILVFWAIIASMVIARYLTLFKPPKPPDEPIDEYNPERTALEDELNQLYYELDLLQQLSDKQNLDTASDDLTASQIKQALSTEKAIHATLKKIKRIELKLERLDE